MKIVKLIVLMVGILLIPSFAMACDEYHACGSVMMVQSAPVMVQTKVRGVRTPLISTAHNNVRSRRAARAQNLSQRVSVGGCSSVGTCSSWSDVVLSAPVVQEPVMVQVVQPVEPAPVVTWSGNCRLTITCEK